MNPNQNLPSYPFEYNVGFREFSIHQQAFLYNVYEGRGTSGVSERFAIGVCDRAKSVTDKEMNRFEGGMFDHLDEIGKANMYATTLRYVGTLFPKFPYFQTLQVKSALVTAHKNGVSPSQFLEMEMLNNTWIYLRNILIKPGFLETKDGKYTAQQVNEAVGVYLTQAIAPSSTNVEIINQIIDEDPLKLLQIDQSDNVLDILKTDRYHISQRDLAYLRYIFAKKDDYRKEKDKTYKFEPHRLYETAQSIVIANVSADLWETIEQEDGVLGQVCLSVLAYLANNKNALALQDVIYMKTAVLSAAGRSFSIWSVLRNAPDEIKMKERILEYLYTKARRHVHKMAFTDEQIQDVLRLWLTSTWQEFEENATDRDRFVLNKIRDHDDVRLMGKNRDDFLAILGSLHTQAYPRTRH